MRDAYRGGELVKNNRMGERDRPGAEKSRAEVGFSGARLAAAVSIEKCSAITNITLHEPPNISAP